MINNKEPELFFGVDIVTKARCICGWQGKIEDCIQETVPDFIDNEYEPYIVDKCPVCKREVEYA